MAGSEALPLSGLQALVGRRLVLANRILFDAPGASLSSDGPVELHGEDGTVTLLDGGGEDGRAAAGKAPAHKLTDAERAAVLEVAPAIKVEGQIIVDGNHRYIAGRILGQEPTIQPWVGGRGPVVPWEHIKISTEW